MDVIPTLGTSAEQLELMRKLLQRGSPSPDIFLIDVIWPGTLHEHLLDLAPYLTSADRKHLPALTETATVAKRIVGLPFYMNAGMLYYRADLLKKYGYDAPPASWTELQAAALRVQEGNAAAARHHGDLSGRVLLTRDSRAMLSNGRLRSEEVISSSPTARFR